MLGRLKIVLLLFTIVNGHVSAQTFEAGLALEQAFKDEEALAVYEQIIKANPNHIDALAHGSRMLLNIGGRPQTDKARKSFLVNKAQGYAERAVKLNERHAQAHLSLAIAYGLQSEISSSASEKVKNAKLIYKEGKTLLKLDSNMAVAHFILGKWHLELARLNWMERAACNLFFGGMPEGVSLDNAIAYMQRASTLEPGTILYLYNEALAYHHSDDDKKALQILKQAITLPNKNPDDDIRKEKCKTLMRDIE